MKKKGIVIGIFIVAIVLVLIGSMLLFSSKTDGSDDKKNSSKKYNSLMELAKEMYADGSYIKLPKDEEKGVYYMTFDEYKKRGYNDDIIDSSCPGNFKILYFDIEDTDDFSPIYTISSCNDQEKDDSELAPETSLIKIANELYESNEYLNFIKGDGGYYMTIGMYKEKGYDASLVNPSCPDDSGVLFFDIDHREKYENNPVFVIYECN